MLFQRTVAYRKDSEVPIVVHARVLVKRMCICLLVRMKRDGTDVWCSLVGTRVEVSELQPSLEVGVKSIKEARKLFSCFVKLAHASQNDNSTLPSRLRESDEMVKAVVRKTHAVGLVEF